MSALPSVAPFPVLPRPSRAATRSAPASSFPSLGAAIIHPLRALASRWQGLAAARRESRLRRAAARGRPIFVGTPERPYQPASPAPWSVLSPFSGLAVRIATGSPEIVGELPALAELDRRHAVAVDLVIAGDGDPSRWEPTVRRLAAEGITTRVLLRPGGRVGGGEAGLRRLFATARRAGAFDLQVSPAAPEGALHLAGGKPGDGWVRRFRRLRLEHGFPQPRPGRG